jgi:hypothetical protein
MSNAELKLKLEVINKITDLKESRIINEIKRLLDFELEENIFELSNNQVLRVNEARIEYEKSEILSEEQANSEVEKWLKER